MDMKMMVYVRCLIDMSMYNNFNKENNVNEILGKIDMMLENKNIVN